jgi:hypothetical protein
VRKYKKLYPTFGRRLGCRLLVRWGLARKHTIKSRIDVAMAKGAWDESMAICISIQYPPQKGSTEVNF